MKVRIAAAALVGFVAGAIAIAALGSDRGEPSGAAPPDASTSTTVTTISPPLSTDAGPEETTTTPTPTTEPPGGPPADTLLVWTSGGLPPGFADAVAGLDTVDHVSVASGDQAALLTTLSADAETVESHTDGWSVPLDVLAIDPGAHAPFAPGASALADLAPGTGLLTETSAQLRGIGPGAAVVLESGRVAISGVIPDLAGAGAELIVHIDDARRLGVDTERFILVDHAGDRVAVQVEIDATLTALEAEEPIRFRTPSETTWLRHGDAVLPAAIVKSRFGEFAVRDLTGRSVEISESWIAEHIVTAEVPILGTVRCHEALIEPLTDALESLIDSDLSHLVDPSEYDGCFEPRRINVGLPLSRHTWGVAFDLGSVPRQSFEISGPVVEAFREVGLTWGGSWLVPDSIHFEAIDLR